MPVGYYQDLRQAPWVLLVGSWTNIILYTVELLFIIYFLSNCSFRASKVYLGLTLSLDTICTAAVCGHVYYFVTGTSTMNPRQWTTPLVMVPTFLAGAMEQAFLVFRYRTLSGRRRLSAVLWGITVLHTVFSILGPTHAIYTQSGWKPANFAIIIASTLSCATDLLIAGLMVRTLQTAPIIYDSTRSLLRRISILAVMCGCTSALATLLMLISFFFNFDAYTFILFCLGRIYTLTVLSNISLLQRISIRLGLGTGVGGRALRGGSGIISDFQNSNPNLNGVTFDSTRTVGRRRFGSSAPEPQAAVVHRHHHHHHHHHRRHQYYQDFSRSEALNMRRHVMSAPRTEIRSTPFDPLSKPTTHVPSFSMDSFILPFSSSSMGTTLESELEEEEEVVGTKGSTIDDEEMELGEVKEMKDLEELEEEDPERSKKEMEMESAETAVSVSVYVANTNT